jgi:hypothetical protein
MAFVKVPPHARAGQDGRGHRFAAYPRCSADLRECDRDGWCDGAELAVTRLAVEDRPPWPRVLELSWLGAWLVLLIWGIVAVKSTPSHLAHHVSEGVVLGGFVLGVPASAIVCVALLLLSWLASGVPVWPSAPPTAFVLLYWSVFAIPAVWQRRRRLSILSSLSYRIRRRMAGRGVARAAEQGDEADEP